jgi:HK97 gp10 family phage protein
MAKTLEQEVKEAIKKLQLLPKEFSKKTKRKMLRKAAKPLINAARNNIGDSNEPHYRYKTSKASNKLRAPKGKGNVVAVYHPGNLRKSIKALTFRKSSDIFVGPRVAKRGSGGHYGKGSRVDGYYAAMVEFGTRNTAGQAYMRRAVPAATQAVQKKIISETKIIIENFKNKNKV